MNIESVRSYMMKANEDKFSGMLDFSKIKFVPSSDNGIIVDVDEGIHSLRVGRKISDNQMNRALVVMLVDTVMNIQEEHQRKRLGEQSYGEYGGKISQLQAKYFPSETVYVEKQGRIVEDSVIDCDAVMCKLRKTGNVEKSDIIGLKYKEIKLKK